MVNRLRSGSVAGSAVLVLVLAVSGTALAAKATSDTSAPFQDVDGDGVDDACQEAATENTDAASAAFEAADLNGDGEISVTEAAQSGWTGGTNCNHGGYVSQVAQADDAACAEPETGDAGETGATGETADDAADCTADPATDEETEDAAPTDEESCEEVAAPELDPATDTSEWNHGAWVAWVAGSAATGGKNCNHGGAVSEAAKKDHGSGPDAAKGNAKHANHGHGKGHKTP